MLLERVRSRFLEKFTIIFYVLWFYDYIGFGGGDECELIKKALRTVKGVCDIYK